MEEEKTTNKQLKDSRKSPNKLISMKMLFRSNFYSHNERTNEHTIKRRGVQMNQSESFAILLSMNIGSVFILLDRCFARKLTGNKQRLQNINISRSMM